jgi:poly(3-hydroxyalkanoate) depolymerase
VSTSAASSPDRIRVLSIEGTRVRVSVRGEGRPLLLVMGIGASLDMWGPLEDALAPLGYQLISVDLPGAGGSPAVFPPRRMAGLARIALGVLDELAIVQADVLGLSFGGIVAQEIAHRAPSRVRRLVLCATGPGIGGVPGRPSALRHMVTPRRYQSKDYASRIAGELYGGRARLEPSIHTSMKARYIRPPSMYGYLTQVFAVTGWSSVPWLRRVRVPTLILAGDDDPIIPLANARIMACLLPQAHARVVEGGGHLFLLDMTDEVVGLVDEFLAAD